MREIILLHDMLATDKLNSLILACLFLIREREMEQEQEMTIVAAKVTHSEFLKNRYYPSVRRWLPDKSRYVSYEDICDDPSSSN